MLEFFFYYRLLSPLFIDAAVFSLQEAEPSSWNENHLPSAWLSAAWLRGWLGHLGVRTQKPEVWKRLYFGI